jgi:hypothetical protein
MTVPKRGHHVSSYPLRFEQAATGSFAQGFNEFHAASRKDEGKNLLIASRWQDHTKAPFTTETGRRSLVNEFDRKQIGFVGLTICGSLAAAAHGAAICPDLPRPRSSAAAC